MVVQGHTIAGRITTRGHTGRGGGSFSERILILKVIFIQVQTTDGLCQDRALIAGELNPARVKTIGTMVIIRRTSRRAMIIINQVWRRHIETTTDTVRIISPPEERKT